MTRLDRPTLLVPVEAELGEGPLWHPEREDLFFTDIRANALYACDAEGKNPRRWAFPESVSAAAWIDRDRLLLASETGLWRFDIPSADCVKVWDLEADDPLTRSNDGRTSRQGDFWIGSMGKRFEPGAGAIWRVTADGPQPYRTGITVANALAFAPDGRTAYWTDTPTRRIMRQPLDEAGAPLGDPSLFAETPPGAFPDGAVCDAEGCLWNAQWDAWRVVRYRPDGTEDRVIPLPVQRPTCPAFGGPDLTRLFVTSARVGLTPDDLRAQPGAGGVFAMDLDVPGLPEARFPHLDARPL